MTKPPQKPEPAGFTAAEVFAAMQKPKPKPKKKPVPNVEATD